jgi:hypothetical protein
MDLTPRRRNEPELTGLDPASMLVACLCASHRSVSVPAGWLISQLFDMHRLHWAEC